MSYSQNKFYTASEQHWEIGYGRRPANVIFTCVRLNVQHFKISKQKTTELFCCFFFARRIVGFRRGSDWPFAVDISLLFRRATEISTEMYQTNGPTRLLTRPPESI